MMNIIEGRKSSEAGEGEGRRVNAAARLRELHERYVGLPENWTNLGMIEMADLRNEQAREIADMLPEIAAVIEAAETMERQEAERETGIQAKWYTRREKALNDMREALAALSARLGGE